MRILAKTNPTDIIVDDLVDVVFTKSETETLHFAQQETFDAILLAHPIVNGFIGEIRSLTPRTPIIVVIPFNEPALVEQYLARHVFSYAIPGMSINGIRLLIRAAETVKSRSLVFGALILTGRELRVGQSTVRLTPRESGMLRLLMLNPDQQVKRDDFMVLFGYKSSVNTHTIESHMYRLRRRLEDLGQMNLIVTERGGYRLQRSEPA